MRKMHNGQNSKISAVIGHLRVPFSSVSVTIHKCAWEGADLSRIDIE